jgi:hypothetical protein
MVEIFLTEWVLLNYLVKWPCLFDCLAGLINKKTVAFVRLCYHEKYWKLLVDLGLFYIADFGSKKAQPMFSCWVNLTSSGNKTIFWRIEKPLFAITNNPNPTSKRITNIHNHQFREPPVLYTPPPPPPGPPPKKLHK